MHSFEVHSNESVCRNKGRLRLEQAYSLHMSTVGDCGKTRRENGAMECPNIGLCGGTYDTLNLEKGEISRGVRSYADITREDVQTPLGQNRLIIP